MARLPWGCVVRQNGWCVVAGVFFSGLAVVCGYPAFNQATVHQTVVDAKGESTLRQWIHPFDLPQVEGFPDELGVVVEIPQGSITKYEIDPLTGIVAVDRFQSMPVVYPTNYGVITSTLAGDGDNLDVLLLSREPVVPGAMVKARPIGALRMLDGGEEDDKIIAVPTSKIDPTYDVIQDLADLPAIELQRIESFFRVYKQLPEGRKLVELNGFLNVNEAKSLIRKAGERYREGASVGIE